MKQSTQMTFNTDIQKTEKEIAVLQKKLELLKEIETYKSPVENAYKVWWGQYPELETDSEYDDTRWKGFQAGFQAAYEEKLKEDDYCDEVGCDEKDNPKPMDEVVNRLIKKHQAQKLFNRLVDELGYDFDACNDIVDLVESWLPKEHDTNSDGWNKCVRMLRENIR